MSKEARSEGSNLAEGGGDEMRGVGIPGRKNSYSRHFTQCWEIHVSCQSVSDKNSQYQ